MRNLTVETRCNLCGKVFIATKTAYKQAKKKGKLPYCSQECGRFTRKSKVLTLEEAIALKGERKWKGTVTFNCQVCGCESSAKYHKIVGRVYGKQLPICTKCICKWTTNLPEWRNKNSEAQIVAQNKPGQREINSRSVIEACKRHDVYKRKSEAMRLKWKDDEYRDNGVRHLRDMVGSEKHTINSARANRFMSGYYRLKNGSLIFYCSGWELMYVKFCDDNSIPIKRCTERIKYDYRGKSKIYLPDFVIEYLDRKVIVEIKGKYTGSFDTVEPKKIATISFVKSNPNYDDYVLYMKDELKKIGIDLSNKNIKKVHDEAVKNYQNN